MMAADLQIGQRIEGRAGPLLPAGECVVRAGDLAIRVPGLVPGERVAVEITGLSRGAPIGWGRLLQVLDPGAAGHARRAAPCPLHAPCGGCGLQHLEEEARLRFVVQGALPAFEPELAAALAPEGEWIRSAAFGWRHKAVLLPALRDGRLALGGFARGSHTVVDLAPCMVLAPGLQRAQARLTALLEPMFATGSLIAAPPGCSSGAGLRALVLRGSRAGEVLVTAVVRDQASRSALIGPLGHLVAAEDVISGAFVQVFDAPGDVVHGPTPPETILGANSLEERIAGVPLRVLPLAFFQVNPGVLEGVVALLRARAGAASRIVDAYCGAGALGLAVAQGIEPRPAVLGCDIVPAALQAARDTAEALGIRAQYHHGGAEALLGDGALDLVLLDPPRRGCTPEALAAVQSLGARRILYVACSGQALGRDARALMGGGYRPRGLWPADMLPQTPHVEWVAEFERDPG